MEKHRVPQEWERPHTDNLEVSLYMEAEILFGFQQGFSAPERSFPRSLLPGTHSPALWINEGEERGWFHTNGTHNSIWGVGTCKRTMLTCTYPCMQMEMHVQNFLLPVASVVWFLTAHSLLVGSGPGIGDPDLVNRKHLLVTAIYKTMSILPPNFV